MLGVDMDMKDHRLSPAFVRYIRDQVTLVFNRYIAWKFFNDRYWLVYSSGRDGPSEFVKQLPKPDEFYELILEDLPAATRNEYNVPLNACIW